MPFSFLRRSSTSEGARHGAPGPVPLPSVSPVVTAFPSAVKSRGHWEAPSLSPARSLDVASVRPALCAGGASQRGRRPPAQLCLCGRPRARRGPAPSRRLCPPAARRRCRRRLCRQVPQSRAGRAPAARAALGGRPHPGSGTRAHRRFPGARGGRGPGTRGGRQVAPPAQRSPDRRLPPVSRTLRPWKVAKGPRNCEGNLFFSYIVFGYLC